MNLDTNPNNPDYMVQETPINTDVKQVYCMACKREIINERLFFSVGGIVKGKLSIYCLECADKKNLLNGDMER